MPIRADTGTKERAQILGLSFFDCAEGDTALRIRYVESPGFIDAYNHLRVNRPDNIAVQRRCAT